MKFSVCWAMPSRHTFEIAPIANMLARHTRGANVIVDPFCGRSTVGTHRNDLALGGKDAEEFCRDLLRDGVAADVVLFDPPYSPRQISECYRGIGRVVMKTHTQSAALYARVRKPLLELLKPGGKAISFGWQSSGFGKSLQTEELMLVQHGGAHNDTICVVQRKPTDGGGIT